MNLTYKKKSMLWAQFIAQVGILRLRKVFDIASHATIIRVYYNIDKSVGTDVKLS